MTNGSMAPPRKKAKTSHYKALKEAERKAIDELDEAAKQYNGQAALFDELPLSPATKRGLKSAFYTKLTDIQARALPLALKGKDVLGAARTGSGKTLAFLVPVLEMLLRKKWGPTDGLGALIISPTRELAVQIFEVLKKIGHQHQFSAGLVIGGKDLKSEKERLARMNILVATPGRLLQHMDQTLGFETDQLQILVLDEADRILDMGFAATVNAIVANLPSTRQTLLFSATQTKSVKDLARLSLRDPEYVAVRQNKPAEDVETQATEVEQGLSETPKSLEQHYIVVDLDKKIDTLWSFVKTHLFTKTIVFLSSGKQVRFVYENFRHLRPGVPLLHMLGKQKQKQRLEIYQRFLVAKHAILFATDIAARGLDFPSVDWVVQVDCPEDVETYIHRVGRTSRYESKGKALLFLLPSEQPGMSKRFEAKNIPIAQLKTNAQKQQSIRNQLQSSAFQYPEMKFLAQKAFISYVRSIHLQPDKSVFKLDELDLDKYALSLGLAGSPKINFTSKEDAHRAKNAVRELAEPNDDRCPSTDRRVNAENDSDTGSDSEDSQDETSDGDSESSQLNSENDDESISARPSQSATRSLSPVANKKVKTKYDRMFARKSQTVLSEHYRQLLGEAEEDGDEFISLKRKDHDLNERELPESSFLSKRALRRGVSKKANLTKHGNPQKIVFGDDGEARDAYGLQTESDFKAAGDVREQQEQFARQERERLAQQDIEDKRKAKDKRREKAAKRKRADVGPPDSDGRTAYLAVDDADDGYITPEFGLSSSEGEHDGAPRGSVDLEELALRSLRR